MQQISAQLKVAAAPWHPLSSLMYMNAYKGKAFYKIELVVRILDQYITITVQYSTVQYSTVQYSTVQYSTVQYSTVQYSTVQYSTVQYSTVQYSTVQYSTVQYNLQ